MANQNHQQPQMDASVTLMLCIALFVLFAWVIWERFHTELSTAYIYLQLAYSYPIYLIKALFLNVGLNLSFLDIMLKASINLCQNIDPTNLIQECGAKENFSKIKFMQLSAAAMPWNTLFSGLALFWVFMGYRDVEENHPNKKFAKTHTLDSFMEEQKQNHSHLKLFSEFNLLNVNQNEGPFMGMKTVQEFALEHGLVYADEPRMIKTIDNGVTKSQDDQSEKVPVVDRDVLIPILREQLGSLWVGVEFLTDAEAILLAMYLPRACSIDPNMHDDEFSQISKDYLTLEERFWDIASEDIIYSEKFKPNGQYPDGSPIYPDGKKSLSNFDIPYLKEIINKYIDYPVAKKLLSKHAYTRTFIIAVVYEARKLGVMAPCQLRWLKFYDREMWALLQNIGRPSFFSENMGAVSHYTAETVALGRIYQPHFDIAIRGYEHQIKIYFYSDEAMEKLKSKHKNYKKN